MDDHTQDPLAVLRESNAAHDDTRRWRQWPDDKRTRKNFYTPANRKSIRRPYTLARSVDGELYGLAGEQNIGNDPFTRSIFKRSEATEKAAEIIRAVPRPHCNDTPVRKLVSVTEWDLTERQQQ